MKRRVFVILALLFLELKPGGSAADTTCPEGQVPASPHHCTFKNICRDGTVLSEIDGKCEPPVRNNGCEMYFRAIDAPIAAAGCSGRMHGPGRKLFVANGNAGRILEEYVQEAERRSIKVELERLDLYFFTKADDTQQQHMDPPRLTLGQMLSSKTALDVWKTSLAGVVAVPRNDPKRDADRLGADLACGKD
jgi:hypothetical protein